MNVGEESFAFWCRAFKLPPFVREYAFHPTRRWRLDFAWPEFKVAIEIDGGIWMPGGGAHSRPANVERDIEKHNALTLLGWRWLRVKPSDVKRGTATDWAQQLLSLAAAPVERTA